MPGWIWTLAGWSGVAASRSVRRRLLERYKLWRAHCLRMDDWWKQREEEAEQLTLSLRHVDSDRVRNYIHTTTVLATAGRRDSVRFQLLTLLQTRVLMGDPL